MLEDQLQRGRGDGYTHRAGHTNKLSGNEPTDKVKSEVKDICYTYTFPTASVHFVHETHLNHSLMYTVHICKEAGIYGMEVKDCLNQSRAFPFLVFQTGEEV